MDKRKPKKRCEERIYCKYIKRILDALFSFLLLFFLLLPLFVICVIIRIDSPGKAIFKQKRIGRGGKPFVCYKLRTMYKNAPPTIPASAPEEQSKYITRVGRFLRRSSLDELPQLFNVLKGDMSLVGPRPLILEESGIHEGRMNEGVYKLRPGITGMAQIDGRNRLDDGEKLKRDAYYLQNIKMRLDAKIIFNTALKVIRGEGVDADRDRQISR